MTKQEQDKIWNNLSAESKTSLITQYNSYGLNDTASVASRRTMEETFGPHNLCKLTYEDVAKELFEDGYYYYDYVYDRIVTNSAKPTMPMACISQNQVRKLCAINQLLNVAKYLNKNEDGSDWVLDFNNKNEDKWHFYLIHDNGDEIKIGKFWCFRSSFVYFRTKEIAQRAMEILGEETIRRALGNY